MGFSSASREPGRFRVRSVLCITHKHYCINEETGILLGGRIVQLLRFINNLNSQPCLTAVFVNV